MDEGHGILAKVDENFIAYRNNANDYLIDREGQKHSSYTGVKGLAEQDAMIQETQGLIVDRTRERLTAPDAAVVRFRRMVMEGAQALAETGEEPEAPWRHDSYHTRPGSWIAADGVPFDDVLLDRFGDPLGRVPVERN